MDEEAAALSRFREVAIEWAAGGWGQRIVDAATMALVDGLDSPSLRMLAGVPHAFADEEAFALAPLAFDELGLEIEERLSSGAYVDAARQEAQRFLDGEITERELARLSTRFCAAAGYPEELCSLAGLDDYYELIEDGDLGASVSTLDSAVKSAAEDLVNHRNGQPISLSSLFSAIPAVPRRRRWSSRILRES